RTPRLAVLPFESLGTREDQMFAAGLTEEITSRLAALPGLTVISRTTAVNYDPKGKTVRQIGAEVDVDFVLEGAVRCGRGADGERIVRITPRLIRVADDTRVWGERYDSARSDA